MRKYIKNKKGMTLVELIVALSLLMLIVFVFSPMLLSSYSTIYEAGAREEAAYNAKSDIETHLAVRTARDQYNNFVIQLQKNAVNVVDAISVQGKRITTNVLETIFYNGKPHLKIISGPVIDNNSYHKMALYTENLNYTSKTVTATNEEPKTLDKKEIKIRVTAPDKTYATSAITGSQYADESQVESAYNKNIAVSKIVADPVNGLISFEISGFDFTVSPIRLRIYYVADNNKIEHVDSYIEVQMPTLILGGDAKAGADYYTTSGVITESVGVEGGGGTALVNSISPIEGRTMSTGTTKGEGTIQTPSSFKVNNTASPVDIQSISYVNSDLELNKGIKPFYVLTGTNGAIYRTYGFSNKNTFLDNYSKYSNEHYYTVKNSNETYRQSVYPTFWSGDETHQFYYTTYYDSQYSIDYGGPNSDRDGDHSWRTENTSNRGTGIQTFTNRATYSFFRNGYDVDFNYKVQNKKNISYILTERGTALRLHGRKLHEDDFWGAQQVWNVNNRSCNTHALAISFEKTDDINNVYYCYTNTDSVEADKLYNQFCQFSSLTATSINTGSLKDLLSDVDGDACQSFLGGKNSGKHDYSSSSKVNITSSAYIESLGKMLYLGTVDANAYVMQQDNDYEKAYQSSDYAKDLKALNNEEAKKGGTTGYCIIGTTGSEGTTIYKASTTTNDINKIATVGADPKFKVSGDIYREFKLTNTYDGQIVIDSYISKQPHSTSTEKKYKAAWARNVFDCWCDYHRWKYDSDWMNHMDHLGKYQIISAKIYDNMGGTSSQIAEKHSHWEPHEWHYEKVNEKTDLSLSQTENTASYTTANELTESTTKVTTTDQAVNDFYTSMSPQNIHISDFYFTLGYSSNREFVYSLISFGKSDKNKNGKLDSGDDDYLTEKYKSYEPYYFLSHYGTGYSMQKNNKKYSLVSSHSPNYTPNGSNSYINSYNNDYYNVWFPGECYNLTKTASLNGVVVGVGYAVSGSTYQWLDNLGVITNNTSTALGGLFNDGVLAVCTPGGKPGDENEPADANFENKLYFKDNATMDTDYLSNPSKNTAPLQSYDLSADNSTTINKYDLSIADANTYRTKFGTYGTHARQSVRFTSVGLGLLGKGTGGSYSEDYYAYYGDSTGRVFYSKIASEKNGSTTPVSYVADLTAADSVKNAEGAGKMIELKIGGESLRSLFSEIDNITVMSYTTDKTDEYTNASNYDLVVISGKKEGANTNYIVVAKIGADADGVPDVVNIQTVGFSDVLSGVSIKINDSIFLNGYYYAVGETVDNKGSVTGGFLLAVNEMELKSFINREKKLDENGQETSVALIPEAKNITKYFTTSCQSVSNTSSGYTATNTTLAPLYAIGGRSA